MSTCFHCGLPADLDSLYTADIDGESQSFCCIACQTVASAIANGGLADFYRYRDAKNLKAEVEQCDFLAYDLDDVQADFVLPLDDELYEAQLSIAGISCAACAWLIEQRLQGFPDVKEVSVNATNYRCRIVWHKSSLKLSALFSALAEIGFHASPLLESHLQRQRKKENRMALMRLGVAGLGMMQVGMFAIALHAGALQGMEAHWQGFFRIVSFIVATPVVFFSAKPFFANALRSIKQMHLTMDVPVSLAIGLAYIASIWATLSNTGDVYFDSISMFTFFLLLGRFLEMKVRHSSAFASESMRQLLPLTVDVARGEKIEIQPIKGVSVGDRVSVSAGAIIPCDGVVVDGESSVDEALLTGESKPVLKGASQSVFAGTLNGESRLIVEVTAVGNQTHLASIERMVDRALLDKPKIVALADRWASKFVFFVLISAAAVGGFWFYAAPERALWIVLSVLVATCPCALSLATPAALTAGIMSMRKIGLLVTSSQLIEKLPTINHMVFDKTGTLTEGALSISEVRLIGESVMSKDEVTTIIAALEKDSQHPIARAFGAIPMAHSASKIKSYPGLGIEGRIEETRYRFGQKDFALELNVDQPRTALTEYPGPGLWQLLTTTGKPLAWVCLVDKPRVGVGTMLKGLDVVGIDTELLSGDREENVSRFAEPYDLSYTAHALPDQKLQRIQSLQKAGKQVLMVGDGINDVPVLSGADLSIAMGEATRLAQTHADAVLVSGELAVLSKARRLAFVVRAKIKQNLTWAFLYNASILPLAAAGLIPPYIAAIGMSLSSLFVVVNALSIRNSVPSG
ncbi:MAG: heavy metal translocating P-type ATPase [Agarilytica sp.]